MTYIGGGMGIEIGGESGSEPTGPRKEIGEKFIRPFIENVILKGALDKAEIPNYKIIYGFSGWWVIIKK